MDFNEFATMSSLNDLMVKETYFKDIYNNAKLLLEKRYIVSDEDKLIPTIFIFDKCIAYVSLSRNESSYIVMLVNGRGEFISFSDLTYDNINEMPNIPIFGEFQKKFKAAISLENFMILFNE